ncbi:MAG: PBP1A family penicillin-binding protein, partial [Candidatus Andersenbacteria bacterium]|nr:PBP1A family penicillin-binding protein [Candidatus Andersenbacteria bacterium]
MAHTSKKPSTHHPKPIQRTRKKPNWNKVWKNVWKVTWIGAIVVGVAITATFLWFLKDLPSPDKLDERTVVESTKIFDRSGETVLYEIHGEEKRTRVPLENVAEVMQQAMISAEDKDFYSHFGFDPRGIARAFFSNVASDSRSGGSTITQQLVKNSILTPEQTITRKVKELIIAIEVEVRFSKDEILEMYLNEIPFGSNAYGAEAASQTFFGKSAADLELHEAATLASLPKAPTFYSPYGSNSDRLLDRRNWIMDRMVDDGFITQEEADAAKELPVEVKERSAGIIAGHFVDMVRAELSEVYGERIVEQGGLRVTTTLNMDLQHIAERVVPEGAAKGEANYGATNAALIAIHPATGEVLALQGSRSYFDREHDGNVNVAIRDRQPGSSFKPIIYAAAFEEGYTPSTNLFDVKTDFGGGYSPNNYDLSQSGIMNIRTALQQSKNIPAVKALYLVGLEDAIAFANKLGITSLNDPDRYGLSLVLGGGEVKLADMVSAFGVFANDGVRKPYVTILTVEDAEGKLLIDNRDRPGEQVIEPQVARLITNVLSDDGARSAVFGSRSSLTLPDRPVAAKTGTTESYRDAWTVGATPDLAAGVWAGNNDGTLMRRGGGGFQVAAPIWNAFMREATAGTEVRDFVAPAPENTGKAVLDGRLGESEEVRLCKPSLKLATDRCPESQVEVKKFQKGHNILYYVDKNNPRGPIPSNPAVDPQFNSWENAVKSWAERENIALEDPPEEFDDTHDPEDAP